MGALVPTGAPPSLWTVPCRPRECPYPWNVTSEDWTALLDDRSLSRTLGPQTLARGATYVRQGRVSDIRVQNGRGVLIAQVQGSDHVPYTATVSAEGGVWFGECSCPVGHDCKHAAAVLLAARTALLTAPEAVPTPAAPAWEAAVAGLLRPRGTTEQRGLDVGLLFEIESSGRTTGSRGVRGTGPAFRLRPVVPGKRGGWIRTGISWRALEYPSYGLRHYRTDQLGALAELYRVHLPETGYHYGEPPVYLHDFSPALWPVLQRAVDAGVALVTDRGGVVQLADAPARLALDVRRAAPEAELTLEPLVLLEHAPVPAAGSALLGAPAHGVAVFGAHCPSDAGIVAPDGLLLAPLARRPTEEVTGLVRAGTGLVVPPEDADRFSHDFLPGLRRAVSVISTDSSVELPEILPPRLGLAVTYHADHRVELEWTVRYETGGSDVRLPLHGAGEPDEGPAAMRDQRAEERLLSSLRLPGERLPGLWADAVTQRPAPRVELRGMGAVVLTEEVLPDLRARDDVIVEVTGTPPDYREAREAPLVRVSATDGTDPDWFDLGVAVSIAGEDVPFASLFLALAAGDGHMVLPSGTWFSLDRPEFQQLRQLIDEARALQDTERPRLRISRYQAGLWEELVSLGVVDEQSERWTRNVQELLELESATPPETPAGLSAELRPYQRDGFQWLSFLWDHELGGILADDMGLGKTLQTLALVCRAKAAGELTAPVLVVAPTSVVSNWAREAQRFAPELEVRPVTATPRRRRTALADEVAGADVVVTSYALFRIEFEAYDALPWRGLILDEAQIVKNNEARTYQCARRLTAPFKLAITGTPLENSLMDLWALLSIVAPGLFPSPKRFTEFYRLPIERGTDPALMATLRRRIRPLVRRRTKDQVATELPPKQEQVLEVELNPKHRKIYQTHLQRERRKVLGLVDDMQRNRFTIFRSLTLLRQLSLDPALVDDDYADVPSSKAEAFLSHLREVVAEGHRVLVFSQFTGFLRRVRDRLDAEGLPYVYLDGRTRDRARRIEDFRAGRAPVFLISLKAGGFGLNLTEADYVFVLDPWWNPAVEAQAVDRAHRIGQDKTVMVYRLVSSGTIEEKVMALKARKQDLFDRVLDDEAALSGPLTAEDIRGLFAS